MPKQVFFGGCGAILFIKVRHLLNGCDNSRGEIKITIEKVVERYLQLINTEQFAKYEKGFAYRIQMSLYEGYKQGLYEPTMVSLIEKIINKLDGLSASGNRFKISIKSIFYSWE